MPNFFRFNSYALIMQFAFLAYLNLGIAVCLNPKKEDLLKGWDIPNVHCTKGKLASYKFSSLILNNKRDIWVYTPPSYDLTKGPYPFLIVFDGQAYISELIPGPTILDNLISEGKIPPLIAVFISSMDQPTRNRELPCNRRFVQSLTQELLPWISQNFSISNNPSHIIAAGSSYGGLAAAYAAFLHPEIFGNVLSQSGAFWWNKDQFSPEPWLVRQFEALRTCSTQFYLDVGDQEIDVYKKNQMSMVDVNRYFCKILEEKGSRVAYYEFAGGHDYKCWRKTFAIGLMALYLDRVRAGPNAEKTQNSDD